MSSQSCHELAQLQGAGPQGAGPQGAGLRDFSEKPKGPSTLFRKTEKQGAGLATPRSKAQGLHEPAS